MKLVAVDTETTGLSPQKGDRVFAVSMASREDPQGTPLEGGQLWTKYFSWPVNPRTRQVIIPPSCAQYAEVKSICEDPSITKVFHNSGFDIRHLRYMGIEVKGRVEDILIASKILHTTRMNHKLKSLAKDLNIEDDDDEKALKRAVKSLRMKAKDLGWKTAPDLEADYWLTDTEVLSELIQKWLDWKFSKPTDRYKKRELARGEIVEKVTWIRAQQKGGDLYNLSVDRCQDYAVKDALRTLKLWYLFRETLMRAQLVPIYTEETYKLRPVVAEMEDRGVMLNKEVLEECHQNALKARKLIREEIERLSPGFNPNSLIDRRRVFVTELQLDPLELTPKGNPKLDKTFMAHHAKLGNRLAACCAQLSKTNKSITTYFKPYSELMNDEGVIFPTFDQVGARTLRFSCRNPNFQQVPKRAGDYGDVLLECRKPFGPRPGYVWWLLDYSQIEARIFAQEAQELHMLKAFKEDADVYEYLNQVILDRSGLNVGRQVAKSIFLGKLYGLGTKKLVATVKMTCSEDISRDDAANILQVFNQTFPVVQKFMQKTQLDVVRDGYVKNRFGQRLMVEKDLDYKGVNYLIQSTAARVMKRALIRCAHYFKQESLPVFPVMTIHDELVFEANGEWTGIEKVKEIMEDNSDLFPDVDLLTELSLVPEGGSWLHPEKKELLCGTT